MEYEIPCFLGDPRPVRDRLFEAHLRTINRRRLRHSALRSKRLKQATPPWVCLDDLKAVYDRRDRMTFDTGIAHEVDHIVPICGPGVCGLNVPWNLQIVLAQVNKHKYAKLDEASVIGHVA